MYHEHRKALVIGIDDYPVFPLSGCVNDASKVARLLERHGDGRPNFEVNTLLSSQRKITKSVVKQEIERLFSGSPSIALLYFAGHGFVNSYGGYFVTPDYEAYEEGIALRDVQTAANHSSAKDRIIIADCCYSGVLTIPDDRNSLEAGIPEGVTILTSSSATGKSYEGEHGLFSKLLIDALEGQCADLSGNILPSNIYAYIDRALGSWQQRPVYKTNVSRFVSIREVSPPIDLSVLRKLTEYFPDCQDVYSLDPTYEFTHPDAVDEHVRIFQEMQKLEGVGLIQAIGEEHMYFAAIKSKSCGLTLLGRQYWSLVKNNKI